MIRYWISVENHFRNFNKSLYFEGPKIKDAFASQPFLTNGSGFIHKKRFCKNQKFNFPAKLYEKKFEKKILYFKEIDKLAADYFFIGVIFFVY